MELAWWEWEELEGAILQRHELWREHPDRALTYFRMVDDTPVYALQAIPAPGQSEFRLVQVSGIALTWPQVEVDSHLAMMRERFTSFPFRQEVEQFLLSEDVLRDSRKAHLIAIVIARMQQSPVSGAEGPPERMPFPHEERRFTLHEGGSVRFWQQGEMLRCSMHLRRDGNLGPTSSSFIMLDGHMRIRGTSMKRALEWLTGDQEIEAMLQDPHAYAVRRPSAEEGRIDATTTSEQGDLPLVTTERDESGSARRDRDPGEGADHRSVLHEDGGQPSPMPSDRAAGIFSPGEE